MTQNWNEYYKNGGQSGSPSDYAASNAWLHGILNRHIDTSLDSIVDVACGDLQLWGTRSLGSNYTGIDISETIQQRNRKDHTCASFIAASSGEDLRVRADVVLCFSLLWHIMSDIEYIRTLQNIASYSNKWVFILAWNRNPLNGIIPRLIRLKHTGEFTFGENITDGYNQVYRDFWQCATPIFKDFELISEEKSPVYNFGSMYVFRRKQ